MGADNLAREHGLDSDPIVALIVAGDRRRAVGECARTHGPAIGRLCMAFLGSQHDAEEAAQETLMAAFDAMTGYRGEGTVRAWLFTIARRVCARRVETRVRREAKLRLVRDDEATDGDAEALLAARRRAERVRAALEQLKPSERDAVVLRFESDLSFREVAEACGIDEAAARKRVSRALGRLRETLGEE
jgi:RNA polymerase sigma-70 factor (ECF subfamily)